MWSSSMPPPLNLKLPVKYLLLLPVNVEVGIRSFSLPIRFSENKNYTFKICVVYQAQICIKRCKPNYSNMYCKSLKIIGSEASIFNFFPSLFSSYDHTCYQKNSYENLPIFCNLWKRFEVSANQLWKEGLATPIRSRSTNASCNKQIRLI